MRYNSRLFAIQDEIAERIAGAIEPELLKTESVLAAARHTGNMTAWDLVRRGTWHFHHVTRESHFKARELFRQQNFVWFNLLGLAHLFSGHPNQALDSAMKAQKIRPAWRPIFETLAACYAALGRIEEARRTVTDMDKLDKPAGDALAPLLASNPRWREQRLAYLRDAGGG